MSIAISSVMKGLSLASTAITSVLGSKDSDKESSVGFLKGLNEEADNAKFSVQGIALSQMPPPPGEMDFESMSDQDLIAYIKEMQHFTGIVPGMPGDTDVSKLTGKALQAVRNTLTAMSSQEKMDKVMEALPSPTDISSLSSKNLLALLETIKKEIGSIPGVANSKNTEVSSLSSGQIDNARNALLTMAQKRTDMQQPQSCSYALSAYAAASKLNG